MIQNFHLVEELQIVEILSCVHMWSYEVTLFLVCYGYLESQHRAFLFGGFQREIVLSMVVLFDQLFASMFIVALEVFTGCSAPGGVEGVQKKDIGESVYEALTNNLGPNHDNDWFIVFILFARIIMLLNHKLGIPAGFQAVVCLATAVLLPMPQREKRLSLGAMSMEYIMMLIGAYWAPVPWLNLQSEDVAHQSLQIR